MNKNPLIIFGSSRSDGDTLKAIKTVFGDEISHPIVDLNHLRMSYYDYDHRNSNDDFISLAEKMSDHNPIILATPVYWYTMSAIMKTFLDRWSDLLSIRKDLGRSLKGKHIYVITSFSTSLPKGFEEAFSQTAEYMDMKYGACYYFDASENNAAIIERNNSNAKDFKQKVLSLS